MNKTTLFTLLGVAVIIVAGILIFKNKTPQTPTDTVNTTPDSASAGGTMLAGKKMAFSEMVKQGGAYQCSVDQYLDAGMQQMTKGTVYVDDGKIRGEYSTTVQGMTIDTRVIVRDGFAYTWTSMASIGYKAPVVETVGGDASVGTAGKYSWNDQLIGDYDCKPWSPDSSKFTVPTNITFQTMQ